MGIQIGAAGSLPVLGATPMLYVAAKGVDTIDALFLSTFDGTQWTPSSGADAAPIPGEQSATGVGLAACVGVTDVFGLFETTKRVPFVVTAWASNQSLQYHCYLDPGGPFAADQGGGAIPVGQSGGAVGGPGIAVDGSSNTIYAAWPSPGESVFNFQPLFLATGVLQTPSAGGDILQWQSDVQAIPEALSGDAPGIAKFGNALYVAWKNQDSQDLFVAHLLNGTWHTDRAIPGQSNCGPALAIAGGNLVAAWVDAATDNIFLSRNIPFHEDVLFEWSPSTIVQFKNSNTPPLTKYSPALATFDGQLCLVWADISKTGGVAKAPFGVVEWAMQNADGTWTYNGVVPGLFTGPDF